MKRAILGVMLLAATAFAEPTNNVSKLDGVWKWSFTMPDGTKAEPKVRLKQEGDAFTGSSIPRAGMAIPIIDPKLEGDKVSWTVVREAGGRKVTTRYEGRVEGETIKGTIHSDWAGEPRRYDWLAKRAPNTPAGTWKWETAFGNTRFESTLKLELDGKDKLKGKRKPAPLKSISKTANTRTAKFHSK